MNRGKFGLILGFATVLVFGFTQQPSIKLVWSNTKSETELNHAAFRQNDSQITKAFLMGKFFAAQDARFGLVPAGMSSKAMYLQKDVITAFQTMRRAAMLAGIDLKIISGTRNFWEQKAIWERKWTANVNRHGTGADNARHILLYSSMPGSNSVTSRPRSWGVIGQRRWVEVRAFCLTPPGPIRNRTPGCARTPGPSPRQ